MHTAPSSNLRKARELLALLLVLLCTSHFVSQVLQSQKSVHQPSVVIPSVTANTTKYSQHSFTLLAKIAYAGTTLFQKFDETSNRNTGRLTTKSAHAFAQGFAPIIESVNEKPALYAERILLAHALALASSKASVCAAAKKASQTLSPQTLTLCEAPLDKGSLNASGETAGEEPVKQQGEQTGDALQHKSAIPDYIDPWFEELHQQQLGLSMQPNRAYLEAKRSASKILVTLLTALLVLTLSIYIAGSFFVRARRGELIMRFQRIPELRVELLETFALYNAGMLFLPSVVERFFTTKSIQEMLFINIVGITSLSVLYFWPRIANSGPCQRAFGLGPISPRKALDDIIAAPLLYLGFLSLLFTVVFIYSAVLQYFQVDPSAGSHPIMPILAKNRSNNTWLLAALVAVVVAPLVEELFFRGALYSWLRGHFGAAAAILVSAMIFAVVHPQGALGFVPLTCIGMMLAFAREWRDSLLTPIIAHACVNGVTLLIASSIF